MFYNFVTVPHLIKSLFKVQANYLPDMHEEGEADAGQPSDPNASNSLTIAIT